jgi:hypothetical protein
LADNASALTTMLPLLAKIFFLIFEMTFFGQGEKEVWNKKQKKKF